MRTTTSSTMARLKFDGEQTYGWYAMGDFWVNSARVENIEPNMRELLSGLYVYQLETSSPEHVITEVTFAISHRHIVAMNGGGALCRQIEVPENTYSVEQRTPATAYMLIDGYNGFWDELRAFLQSTTRDVTSNFFHVCSKCPVSYVATATTAAVIMTSSSITQQQRWQRRSTRDEALVPPSLSLSSSHRLLLGKLMHDLFDRSDDLDDKNIAIGPSTTDNDEIWRSWLAINGGSHGTAAAGSEAECSNDDATVVTAAASTTCSFNRALIPLTLEYSLHFLHRMREELIASQQPAVSHPMSSLNVSKTYALPIELNELWNDYVDHNKDATKFPLDGILLIRRHQRRLLSSIDADRAVSATVTWDNDATISKSYYEKIKLRQTIEVFAKRNPLTLCSADHGSFATFHRVVPDREGTSSCTQWLVSPSLVACARRAADRPHHHRHHRCRYDDNCFLMILNLPIPVTDNGQIVELEYATNDEGKEDAADSKYWWNGGNKILRFVRWRPDKELCDKRAKILSILRNR